MPRQVLLPPQSYPHPCPLQGPGSVLVLKPSSQPGPRVVPAPSPMTAAGVYSLVLGGPCRVASEAAFMECSGMQRGDVTEQVGCPHKH